MIGRRLQSRHPERMTMEACRAKRTAEGAFAIFLAASSGSTRMGTFSHLPAWA
jgi:hypothetical protein